jgi:hypothetical protein
MRSAHRQRHASFKYEESECKGHTIRAWRRVFSLSTSHIPAHTTPSQSVLGSFLFLYRTSAINPGHSPLSSALGPRLFSLSPICPWFFSLSL